jgi:hypothetical protein
VPTERPQYDASLAERRYAACDPDNRLIAAQLEKAWETALLSIAGSGSGDVVMLKFLLGRLLPRERPIAIKLPEMEFADDGVAALGSIMRAVSIGAISPDRYRRTRAEAV